MNNQIKTPKGIKIIAGLMFVGGLIISFYGGGGVLVTISNPFPMTLTDFVIMIMIISPFFIIGSIGLLFIIASIGLWKMKKWGLFISYFALGVCISITTIEAIRILILKEVPGVIGVDYRLEVLFWYVPPIFIGISILYYLFRKRRCFYE